MYKSVCTNTDKAWITFCVFSFGVFFPESIKYECKNVMLVTAVFYLDDLFPPLVFHYPFFPLSISIMPWACHGRLGNPELSELKDC